MRTCSLFITDACVFVTWVCTIPKRNIHGRLDKNLKCFAKSVSAIFKKVEVQLSAVISLVVNSESLVRVVRTNNSDMHDTRMILCPILRYTYDSECFV